MDVVKIKEEISNILDKNTKKIIRDGEILGENPEIGFKENKTNSFIKERFKSLKISYKDNIAITGIKADLKGRKNNSKCKVGYFAEMDALMCPNHPKANSEGITHVCGHNIQVAVLLAVLESFVKAEINKIFDGDIAFICVPAEELIDFEYRRRLRKEKKITFLTGKQELIYEGILDDIDMAIMSHVQVLNQTSKLVTSSSTMNGAIAKYVQYEGISAHAGKSPHLGINALNAAIIGLQSINALRETFREEDYIRVHSIISRGGTVVNAVPDDVNLDLFVRAKTFKALYDISKRVDKAFKAGGDAIGAKVNIENIPGYMPFNPNDALDTIFLENAKKILGEDKIDIGSHSTGSTDMGDVSQIIPTIHPWIHAVKGKLHGADFEIIDPYLAYIQNAKIIAWTLIDLLANGANKGLEIKDNSKSSMNKETWFNNWNKVI